MIKVLDLLKDGIYLVRGDVVVNPESSEQEDTICVSLGNYTWIGKEALAYVDGGKFEGWYVTSFAERKHDNGDQPVPDWCKVGYHTTSDDSNHSSEAAGTLRWNVNWENGDWWRPNFDFLVEHYKEDSGSKTDDIKEVIYTKAMFDEGILPEKGMYYNDELITSVNFRQLLGTHPQVMVTFEESGLFCLSSLSFPEPKDLRETVIDNLIECWDNTCTDSGSIEKLMTKFYDTMLRTTEDFADE